MKEQYKALEKVVLQEVGKAGRKVVLMDASMAVATVGETVDEKGYLKVGQQVYGLVDELVEMKDTWQVGKTVDVTAFWLVVSMVASLVALKAVQMAA